MEKKCIDCEYFVEFLSWDDRGSCHRYPPVLVYDRTHPDGYRFVHPNRSFPDWCGEFKQKRG